jgi:hypothetical protein
MSSKDDSWKEYSKHENTLNFSNSMWINDIEKTTLKSLTYFNPDVLIMDFIDERFNLLQLGDSYITNSKEFREGKAASDFVGAKILRRGDGAVEQLWEGAARRFALWLRNALPNTRVVVHHAAWATEYVDTTSLANFSQKRRFPSIIRGGFDENWHLLKFSKFSTHYAKFMSNIIPECMDIKVDSKLMVGSKLHKWGLAPFHYVDEYYMESSRTLKALLSTAR